jgi:hypothetical protein
VVAHGLAITFNVTEVTIPRAPSETRANCVGYSRTVHINSSHPANTEETAGRDSLKHQVIKRKERIQLIFANAGVHCHRLLCNVENDALVTTWTKICVTRKVDEPGSWNCGGAVVSGDQRGL